MGTRLTPFVIVLASVGLSVGVTLMLHPQPAEAGPSQTHSFDASRFDVIEKRLEALERRTPVRVHARDPADVERHPIDKSSEVLSVASLEKRLASLEQRLPQRSAIPTDRIQPAWAGSTEPTKPEEVIDSAKKRILDPGATSKDKLDAHRELRHVKDAYTPAMTQELIRIGAHDPDPEIRAGAWTFFDGASAEKLPELVPHLIRALNSDSESGPRVEAAETLGNFPKDAAAVHALEYAARNDASVEVRKRAVRTLLEIDASKKWVLDLQKEINKMRRRK